MPPKKRTETEETEETTETEETDDTDTDGMLDKLADRIADKLIAKATRRSVPSRRSRESSISLTHWRSDERRIRRIRR